MTQPELMQQIKALPDRLLVEVGLGVLGDNDIDDLSETAAVLGERGGLPPADVGQLAQAATQDTAVIAAVLRLVLADLAATPDGEAAVAAAMEQAGKKQLVLSPSDLALISLLISGALAGYVVFRTGGRASTVSKTKTTFDAKGQIKSIEQDDKVIYVDALTGFGRLLQRVLSGKKGADPEGGQA